MITSAGPLTIPAIMAEAAKDVSKVIRFSARPGRVSGTVRLMVVSAGKLAGYNWEMSDDGGRTWTTLAPTIVARTSVPALVPLKTYRFRYRVIVRSGPRDWSQPISFVVR